MLFDSISHLGMQKKENQDKIAHKKLPPRGDLFVVCDGISGFRNSSKASQLVTESIINWCTEHGRDYEYEDAIKYALNHSNKKIYGTNHGPMGTTVAMCFISWYNAYVGWCGDSRIYHFRDNKILWISKDHNVLHDILNKGSGNMETTINPMALNRFIGKSSFPKYDYVTLEIKKNDKILICTDGLSNYLNETQINNTISKNDPKSATQILTKYLLSDKINAPDNFSWYIIQI